MKPLKVFLVYSTNAAVAYQRMIAPAKYLSRNKELSIAFSQWKADDSKILEWQNHLNQSLVIAQFEMFARKADMMIFQIAYRWKVIDLIRAIKQKYKIPVLMEIDDYMFGLPATNIAHSIYKQGGMFENVAVEQMKISDGMIVSTSHLKELYKLYNNKIKVVPNGIDFEVWDRLKKPTKEKKKLRIGFAGSPNHKIDIEYISNIILQIRDEYPNVEFWFLSCCPDFFKREKRIHLLDRWTLVDKYPQALADMDLDIGIAPLLDNNFNRGKSCMRWLEYSALKIPTIASPIVPFKQAIKHGHTGLLARSGDEWLTAFRKLIENEKLRKSIGNNAYKEVKANHNMKVIADDWVQILKKWK